MFALLWIVAAAARPATTFHLAPLIVAGIPAVALVIDARDSRPRRQVLVAAALGLATALIVTAALTAGSRLSGPSLLPFGGAVAEAVIFSGIGAGAGLLFAVGAER